MAAKGARVHIYGDWDGSGVKKAQKDLSGFQKQAGGFTNAVSKSFLGMGAAIGGAMALGSIVSFAKDYAGAAIEMAQESQKTTDRIEAIGKSMGVFYTQMGGTTKRLTEYAQELQNVTGISDETTKSGQAILLTFSELAKTSGEAGGMFDRATAALLDLSAAGFGDATTNAKSLGKALNDPVKGLTALGRQGITFTEQEKDKVKALVATNQTLEAQNLIMSAVEKQVGGTAKAVANDFDKINAAAADAQELIGFALVDSIKGVTDAFGGSGGLVEVINEAGQYAADLVTGLGQVVVSIADVTAATSDASVGVGDMNISVGELAKQMVMAIPVVGAQAKAFGYLADSGEDYRVSQERINSSISASEALYAGYIATLDGTAAAERDMAMEAEDAADALKELKDAASALKGVISDSQSWDDFRRKMMDLGETLKGNVRNFSNVTDAGRENRDTLRELFADAASQAERWAEKTGASADEFQAKFDGLAKKIVDQFVADGFKRKDVERFLAKQDIWVSQLRQLSSIVTDESKKLGYSASEGIAEGVKNGQSLVATAMSGTVLAAIQAGKNAAKIKSPSQVTRDQVGIPLIDGVIAGMKLKKDELKSTSQSLISDAIGVIEEELQGFDDKIKDAFEKMEADNAAIKSWVASTRDALTSAFDLTGIFESSIDEQGRMTVSTFQAGIEAGLAQFQWYTNVLAAIAQTPGSEQLVAFLQSQGVTNGGAWGQALIDNGLVQYMIDNLKTVTDTSDATAQAMVPGFLASAQASSSALYDQVVKDYGKDGEKRKKLEALMTRLARALDRTSTITIRTVYESVGLDGKRAAGGPVSANKAYLVGERGPEVLVMGGQSGTIIPNADLPTASGVMGGDGAAMGGATYNITVQAGVGDPRQIGQQVVEYIKKFESSNGRVFAAA